MFRADELEQSGTITSQILDGLINHDLLVADLTDHNPNVFYELAIRHAFRKPFVQLIAEGQSLPFDIQGLRTIFVDHTDLDSVHEAKVTLTGMVESIRSGAETETPLTYTVNLQNLRQSENSEARGMAEILDELAGIKRALREASPAGTSASRGRATSRTSTGAATTIRHLRGFVEQLARAGRLRRADVNHMLSLEGVTAAQQKWLTETLEPLVQENEEEPPF